MKPTYKDSSIDGVIKRTFGVDRRAAITSDVCVMCGKPATQFRDALSQKEFSISGMCQQCQDKVFE